MTSDNEPSSLLSHHENQIVFTVLGPRRLSRATAVVQMFHALPPGSNQWSKFKTGVACFVKDSTQRSYFIRMVDIGAKTVIFDQELYDSFVYKRARPHFHTFEGDKFMVGMNFSSLDEAEKFAQVVEQKIAFARRATMKRKPPSPDSGPGHQKVTVIDRPSVNVSNNSGDPFKTDKSKPKKPKGRKQLTKADIGRPTEFRHLAHVGWDPNTGAFNSDNINPEWKKLLDTVGVTEEQLQDQDTAKFIYDFVEKHGGIEEATRQMEASSRKPPPPPSHGRNQPHPPTRHAPHPPPSRGPPRPPPRGGAPPPPPPSRGGGPPAPGVPAPPPPPPIGGPPPPPGLSSGRGGPPPPPPQSGKPHPTNVPPISNARSNLLESIRQGTKLKKVEDNPAEDEVGDGDPELEGMAGALARALQLRSNAIHRSDSEEDDAVEDVDEEDWD